MILDRRYRVLGLLGRGGQGVVLLVEDRQRQGERVAMKVLSGRRESDLLRWEFDRLRRLSHPGLPRVHELGVVRSVEGDGPAVVEPSSPYMTAELVEGRPAAEVADRLPPLERERFVVELAGLLCRVLDHLHGHDLVHRDVKPDNVLVADRPAEARLVDLGLSVVHGEPTGLAAGSLSFMAPEAMAGAAEPRSDLFSLGATLYRLLAGELPFGPPEDAAATVRAAMDGRTPSLAGLAPGLAPGLVALVHALLAPEPKDRPGSARAVLLELGRLFGPEAVGLEGAATGTLGAPSRLAAGCLPGGLRHGAVLGREPDLEQLDNALAGRLDPLGRSSPLLAVVGPAGVGKSALLREVGQRLQLRSAARGEQPPTFVRGGLRAVARTLRSSTERSPDRDRVGAWLGEGEAAVGAPERAALLEALTGLLLAAASSRPAVVCLEGVEGGLEADLALYIHSMSRLDGIGPGLRPPLALVVEARVAAADERPGWLPEDAEVLALGLLPDAGLRDILEDRLGRPLPRAFLEASLGAARGRPALLEAFVERALALGPSAIEDRRALEAIDLGPGPDSALASAVDALADRERNALLALALFGTDAGSDELAELLELDKSEATGALGCLWRSGWVEPDRDGRCRPPSSHLAELAERVEPELSARVHRRAAALLARTSPADLPARAWHALAGGLETEAAELSLGAAGSLLAAGDAAAAADLLEALEARGAGGPAQRRLLDRALVAAGRYPAAAERLGRAVERREAGARVELARVLRLAGDAEGAREQATRALRSRAGALAARALLARLALDRGDARGALVAAGNPAPGRATGPGAGDLDEAAGLARLALGDEAGASAHFEACLERRRAEADPGPLARAANLLGMVAHHAGRWPEATARYAEALALASEAGQVHAAASYAVNLASCRLETGDLGGALEPLTRAVETLAGLGRDAELAAALFNYGTVLLAVSDLEGASRVKARASAAAGRSGDARVEAYCELLAADLLRRRGAARAACELLGRVVESFERLGASREATLAGLARAEALAEAGDLERARATLERCRPGDREASPDLRVRSAFAAARLAVSGAWDGAAAAQELAAARPVLEAGGQRDLLWRADLLAGRLAEAADDRPRAAPLVRAAAAGAGEVADGVPEPYATTLRADPDRVELLAIQVRLAAADGAAPLARPGLAADEPAALRRLLAINKRLNSELRLGRLLDEIMDTVVELTEAERGFLLLKGADGSLSPRSARNIDRRSLAGDELALSRSVATRVVETGAPVLTIDAVADGRFGGAASVHALRLRSVLAVPLRVKGEVVGAVYVDDRLRPGAFDEGALALVQHVADQAAIAIDNARLLSENRRRQRKIESLNRELAAEVDRQRVELRDLRRELDGRRSELFTKYSYDAIVARSASMRSVFRILDRVTDSEVPVVIQGESGTGKELVARAIHYNGPRREGPFVTENCGAIPETLLESILFGHVRGAFTGADRSRPGLFEVASGGTLLLDEVSETSPAMQAKLLRVLQEGELRPVGGDRTVAVDVRVIASSNRDLGALVREGGFREDLYYRLNVITVRLPSLSERPEDIPLLVEHMLGKHGGGRSLTVDRAALRRLTTARWPGNVRQLENEIMRAAVLADDVIREEHLSPEVRLAAAASARPDDELDLRGRVEQLERSLIERALARHQGNQSRAAKTLGLSRFGLQKKMKRLGLEPRPPR